MANLLVTSKAQTEYRHNIELVDHLQPLSSINHVEVELNELEQKTNSFKK